MPYRSNVQIFYKTSQHFLFPFFINTKTFSFCGGCVATLTFSSEALCLRLKLNDINYYLTLLKVFFFPLMGGTSCITSSTFLNSFHFNTISFHVLFQPHRKVIYHIGYIQKNLLLLFVFVFNIFFSWVRFFSVISVHSYVIIISVRFISS